jgi:hypothetical protein
MLKEADDQLYLDIMWNIHKVELDWWEYQPYIYILLEAVRKL